MKESKTLKHTECEVKIHKSRMKASRVKPRQLKQTKQLPPEPKKMKGAAAANWKNTRKAAAIAARETEASAAASTKKMKGLQQTYDGKGSSRTNRYE